ncbi:MAG: hypothetical protein KDL87_12130, partial [Verrucomicrobiae bacterium]|nr:hypothetical protein [Verrucomicrobiae bacterium]
SLSWRVAQASSCCHPSGLTAHGLGGWQDDEAVTSAQRPTCVICQALLCRFPRGLTPAPLGD